MKILIVEDDLLLAECLHDFLMDMSHEEVKVCTTAEEARIAIQDNQYDCVFIDLRLPDVDGLCLLDMIRASSPTLPAVMMSGYPTMENAIEAMRKGACDFLAKPFRFNDLALTIERVTRERRLLLENLGLHLETKASKYVEVLNRELQEKIREQNKLFEIFKEIEAIGSSESLYPYIVRVASRLTAAEKVGFFIFSSEPNSLLLISEHGFSEKQKMERVFHLQNDWVERLRDSNINHIMIDGTKLEEEPQFRTLVEKSAKLACWPFRIRGQLFGFLLTCHNGKSPSFAESDLNLVDVLVKKAALTIENMALYENLVTNFYGILKSLVNALEAKDVYTRKHSERVTEYAIAIARRMSCSETQIESLKTMGHLHDIGKIGIADKILNKPGPLSPEEYELIKKHPVIGESIVSELGLNQDQRAIIRYHHERWDGKGYPDGLAAEEVPLLARIISVADAFDSMTSLRAYRARMSQADAVRELRANLGKQFDPSVVEAFLEGFLPVRVNE
jgi:response regulator RpfG family c-di-GMP phosphodiesterase